MSTCETEFFTSDVNVMHHQEIIPNSLLLYSIRQLIGKYFPGESHYYNKLIGNYFQRCVFTAYIASNLK